MEVIKVDGTKVIWFVMHRLNRSGMEHAQNVLWFGKTAKNLRCFINCYVQFYFQSSQDFLTNVMLGISI